ncbi:transcription antitermination factor NusB [Candidatus Kaiserbacteria bacterium RIFCSPHIGHO2_01_FULL_50_13]|uniref:Transcription antitermination protein NusB n=1 Tax=Candidatus Kaiserbacteria bacterium RIFCSPLOWO2_01_FULL_50_24 TaxID=1798507 RepID=A0A1F6EMG7_9BACT|nr:MAG: transcription antitermination factor NusB [Candidatus Kaiserbacteria bacterium RIFCSPHIGHO2_01_FULL_50_13]OGG74854.1 MAG: transcription antitermination factor NusB [Candidatus Kaiserbacteria bacterium RIFCSPLOWO2_01_FULL_50_24]OGG81434.1 MAG: transcription antitermination factor NusB [Candidatus Kaiserbacteria bacterium RIFCSPLOWO2_02_FULL_51_13]
MANRHLARSVVLQVLFERDASQGALSSLAAMGRLADYAKEFGVGDGDMPFMKELLATAIAKQKEVDEVIVRAAPEWPLEKIAAIDRNILRLGLTELLYADRTNVPAKVAINEAIELAKSFGGDSSSKFVNGVLGAVYVELGEPGKEEGGVRKSKEAKNMPTENLIGAVIYAEEKDNIYLALVHDIFGHWTLSKGKLKPGESHDAGVKRKAKEEIGLTVAVEDALGENEYVANDPKIPGGKKRRHATYFLAKAKFTDLAPKKEGGLDDAQWFPLAKVGDLNFYDDILPVITKAINILAQKSRT